MMSFITVALGGAIGASARYGLGLIAIRVFGSGFPMGTFLANIFGGFLMGLLVGWLLRSGSSHAETIRLFAAIGVLGGFTTFSSFSLEAIHMIQAKAYGPLLAYVGGSVVLSILAVAVGLFLMRGPA